MDPLLVSLTNSFPNVLLKHQVWDRTTPPLAGNSWYIYNWSTLIHINFQKTYPTVTAGLASVNKKNRLCERIQNLAAQIINDEDRKRKKELRSQRDSTNILRSSRTHRLTEEPKHTLLKKCCNSLHRACQNQRSQTAIRDHRLQSQITDVTTRTSAQISSTLCNILCWNN